MCKNYNAKTKCKEQIIKYLYLLADLTNIFHVLDNYNSKIFEWRITNLINYMNLGCDENIMCKDYKALNVTLLL